MNNQGKDKIVWFLNHYAIPSTYAGITRHFDFGKELARRGYRVTIFASNFDHITKTYIREVTNGYKEEMIDGVKFLWVKSYPPYEENDWKRMINMLSYAYGVIKAGTSIKEQPGIIIGSSLHLFTGLAAYIISRRKKSTFIFEVRDLWPQTMVELGSYKKTHPVVWFMYKLEKFLYRRAKKIITVLPKADEYITSLGIKRDKILHIPNGVDFEGILNSDSKTLPAELESSIKNLKERGKFIVGYIGSHGVANNLMPIMEAAKTVLERKDGNIHFLFVGDGNRKQELIEKAMEFNLTNVSFSDAIPKESVPRLLAEVDATIIVWKKLDNLYKYGISANKIFDYMAASKPVIISIDAANNPIEEAKCGISVPPEDIDALTEAVVELYEMPLKDRVFMGKRGREYVKLRHSIPVLTDKLISIFGE